MKGEHSDSVALAGAFAAVMLSNASVDPIGEALTNPRLRAQAKGYLIELAPGRLALLSRAICRIPMRGSRRRR